MKSMAEKVNDKWERRRIAVNVFDKLFTIVNNVFLLLFTIICFYPIYLLLINSLSGPDYVMNGVFFFPKEITLFNYRSVLSNTYIARGIFISASRAVLGTTVTILGSGFLAFIFTKKNLPCRKLLYRMVIYTMYIDAGIIPYYITIKTYGLTNNYLIYILPAVISPYYMILFKTYIESLPLSFEESAALDGAGIIVIYFRIILPLSLPIIASIAVFSSVGQWNSWFDNFLFCTPVSLKTLQLMLYEILNGSIAQMSDIMSGSAAEAMHMAKRSSPVSIRITMTMVTMIPIMAVYPLLQKYFVKGLLLGAIKG